MSGMKIKDFKNAERGGKRTAQPLTVPAALGADPLQEWVRLPRPRERLGGLSRTTWLEQIALGKVAAITLKKPKAGRGIRLIFRPSAESYLKSLLPQSEAGRGGNPK